MRLKIISLKGVQFDGEVLGLNAKTTSGEITVLDHHRPLITVLESGSGVLIKKDGSREKIKINSGFLEVDRKNNLTVLAD